MKRSAPTIPRPDESRLETMRRVAFLAATLLGSALGLKAGDRIPSVNLDYGFPPEKIDLAERVAKKNVILVGLPGAFTPT